MVLVEIDWDAIATFFVGLFLAGCAFLLGVLIYFIKQGFSETKGDKK